MYFPSDPIADTCIEAKIIIVALPGLFHCMSLPETNEIRTLNALPLKVMGKLTWRPRLPFFNYAAEFQFDS